MDWTGLPQSLGDCCPMCGGQALWTGQDCHRVWVTVLFYVWRSSFVDWTALPQSLGDCDVLCVAVKLCGLDRIATEFG